MKSWVPRLLSSALVTAGILAVGIHVGYAAEAFPAKPIRIISPFSAGSPPDAFGRLIAQQLSVSLGQSVVIENRPGAGTNIGTEAVVRALADGYTLLSTGSSSAINATLYEKLNFVFLRDMAPVASLTRVPNVLEVHPSVPVRTVSELIAYAKANPGKINMASPGTGSTPHVAGELFKIMAGVDMLHVPYRTGALADLLAGYVQVMFDGLPASIEQIRAGKLRALAVTTATRSDALPDVQTVSDFLPGYEASTWFGISAPKGTPTEIIDTLNSGINAALADPKIKERLADTGGTVLCGSPADFGMLIAAETEKSGKVIRAASIKSD